MTGAWDEVAARLGALGRGGRAVRVAGACGVALLAANCAGPTATGGRVRAGPDGKYGVTASPRLYGENDPIPKGGGRAMVGKPYDIAGKTYYPQENPRGYRREGLASWYGTAFHGRQTANGEVFDRFSVAAAHPTLPLPSYARVTNLNNGTSMIVRVNDRGPYERGRLIDVSERVAQALEFHRAGTTRVRVEYVGPASTNGSDDTKLMASLRTDGRPAPYAGARETMVADASAAEARSEIAERKAAARQAAAREAAEGGEEAPAPVAAPAPRPRPAPVVQVASADPDDLPLPAAPARAPTPSAAEHAVTAIVRTPVAKATAQFGHGQGGQAKPLQIAAVHAAAPQAATLQRPGALAKSAPLPLRGALPTHEAPPAKAAARPGPMPLAAPPLKIVKSPMPPERPPAPPTRPGRTASGRAAAGA